MTTTGQLSTRRAAWVDYSAPGTYHLQLDTADDAPAFGTERNGVTTLNYCGEILLNVIAMALHRFACVSLKSMEILPHCLILVLVIDSRRISLWRLLTKPFTSWRIRRLMTIPLFVGYVKMNSARRINQHLHRKSGPVRTRRYKDRVMRDSEEIARFCAQLDANFSRIRLSKSEAGGKHEVTTLSSVLRLLFSGLLPDGARLSDALQAPEMPCDTMLFGRALFMPSSLLGSVATCGTATAEAIYSGAGDPGLRIRSVGPGRIFLSVPRER
jgi:hypothetical protein